MKEKEGITAGLLLFMKTNWYLVFSFCRARGDKATQQLRGHAIRRVRAWRAGRARTRSLEYAQLLCAECLPLPPISVQLHRGALTHHPARLSFVLSARAAT